MFLLTIPICFAKLWLQPYQMDLLSLQNLLLAFFIISIIHNFLIILKNTPALRIVMGIDVQTSSLST